MRQSISFYLSIRKVLKTVIVLEGVFKPLVSGVHWKVAHT